MPEEMDLNRERRKQLAELMMEYPTDSGKQEQQTSEIEHTQRLYTCQKCQRGFTAIMGKTRHLEHSQECKLAPQAERFGNRFPECNRNFRNPSDLKEHRKYICIQQGERKQQTESYTEEQAQQQTQIMPIQDKNEETIRGKGNHERGKPEEERQQGDSSEGEGEEQQQQRREQGQQRQIVTMEMDRKKIRQETGKQHTRYTKEWGNKTNKKNKTQPMKNCEKKETNRAKQDTCPH